MIELNRSANGKPKDFIVKVTKKYSIHTCDEDPIDAIKMLIDDGDIDNCKPDDISIDIVNIEEQNNIVNEVKRILTDENLCAESMVSKIENLIKGE